jgi:hypothetical protein
MIIQQGDRGGTGVVQNWSSDLNTLICEWSFASSQLVWSVFLDFFHSFRVYFYIFSTRFECIFTSSPLVSSVVLPDAVVNLSGIRGSVGGLLWDLTV